MFSPPTTCAVPLPPEMMAPAWPMRRLTSPSDFMGDDMGISWGIPLGGVNGDLMVFNGILLLFNGVFCDIYIKLLNSDFMGGLMVILWDSMGFYEIWMGYQGDINGIWWSDGALMRLNDDSLMAPVFSPGTQVGRWCPQWRTPLAYAGNWPGSLSEEIAKKKCPKISFMAPQKKWFGQW